MRVEMGDCENQLMMEIGDKQFKRRDVAHTYRLALESTESATIDWEKVHKAITERWSYFAVEWIRRQAHREVK